MSLINVIASSGQDVDYERSGCESDKFDYELWTGWRAFAIVWVLCTLEYVSVLCEFGNVGVCVNTQWKGDRTREGMNSTTQSV